MGRYILKLSVKNFSNGKTISKYIVKQGGYEVKHQFFNLVYRMCRRNRFWSTYKLVK